MFLESRNFNETSLAQSHQILKLIGQSGMSPDSFAIILNTSLQIFKDPARVCVYNFYYIIASFYIFKAWKLEINVYFLYPVYSLKTVYSL